MNLFKRNNPPDEAAPEALDFEKPSLREVSAFVPSSAKSPEAQRLNLFDPEAEIDEASDQDLAFLQSLVDDAEPRASKKPVRPVAQSKPRPETARDERRPDDLQVFREVAAQRQYAELAKQFNIADVDMGDLLEELETTRAVLRRRKAA